MLVLKRCDGNIRECTFTWALKTINKNFYVYMNNAGTIYSSQRIYLSIHIFMYYYIST